MYELPCLHISVQIKSHIEKKKKHILKHFNTFNIPASAYRHIESDPLLSTAT